MPFICRWLRHVFRLDRCGVASICVLLSAQSERREHNMQGKRHETRSIEARRERMRVELTGDASAAPLTGFEDRGRHRTTTTPAGNHTPLGPPGQNVVELRKKRKSGARFVPCGRTLMRHEAILWEPPVARRPARALQPVRPSLRDPARQARRLQRAREPRRHALHPGLRQHHRPARRPDREEAALPLPARQPRLLHRHARLQLPLRVLPELGDLADAARAATSSMAPLRRPRRSPRPPCAHGCASMAYTYTEPTIFAEYALDTARQARALGLKNVFVSNGYMTGELLDQMAGLDRRHQRRPQGRPRRVLPQDLRRRPRARARQPED